MTRQPAPQFFAFCTGAAVVTLFHAVEHGIWWLVPLAVLVLVTCAVLWRRDNKAHV